MNNDLISREALKKKLAKCGYDIADFGSLFFIIDNAPTERSQGKWNIEHDWVHCSSCGHEQNYPSNFCPNCWAEMRKGGAE